MKQLQRPPWEQTPRHHNPRPRDQEPKADPPVPEPTPLYEIREYLLDLLPGWPPTARECLRWGILTFFLVYTFTLDPFMAGGFLFAFMITAVLDYILAPDRVMGKFKLDENLPLEATDVLQGAGHDAVSVMDQQMGGQSDTNVAEVCQQEGRVIVTLKASLEAGCLNTA